FDFISATGGSGTWTLIAPSGQRELFSVPLQDQTVSLPTTGTYTLVVAGNSTNTGVLSYQFNVVSQGNTPLPTGTPLGLAAVTSGSTAAAGEVDRFSFTLASDTLVAFDSLTNSNTLQWALSGPDGTRFSNAALSQDQLKDLVAGAYVLSVSGVGSATGSYSFR